MRWKKQPLLRALLTSIAAVGYYAKLLHLQHQTFTFQLDWVLIPLLCFLAYYPLPRKVQWGCAVTLLLASQWFFPSISFLSLLLVLLAIQAFYIYKGRRIAWLKPTLIVVSWLLLWHGCLYIFQNNVMADLSTLISDSIFILFLVLVADWQDAEEDQKQKMKTIMNSLPLTTGMYVCLAIILVRFILVRQGYSALGLLLGAGVLYALHSTSLARFRPSAWVDALLIADVLFYFALPSFR
ncbi:MAG: hypothetical protein MUF42_06065 [Cytophagaceae bacterium]|jgi:4-hydroxybenzoate polyprenyltransferase|nr:hypothetical protein [Cytophagaceae bacterium]